MNAVRRLRSLGIAEGLSFLALLFIAMPLKYGMDMPMAVRVVGSLHGLLFVAFLAMLSHASITRDWHPLMSLKIFVASIVPFGFLLIDKTLKADIAAASEAAASAVDAP